MVASPPEAWIETHSHSHLTQTILVASPPEAWIETRLFTPAQVSRRSPPPRRRGLKRFGVERVGIGKGRLPPGGVD